MVESGPARPVKVIYIASYIPRRCGIATYTKNLTNAINLLNPYRLAEIVALNQGGDKLAYPKEVKLVLNDDKVGNYSRAARWINRSGAEVVSLQHEFGLFGGGDGEKILPLIRHLQLPLVTTIHSLPDDSGSDRGRILKEIIDRSQAAVVMIHDSKSKLIRDYGINQDKIVVIPHGIPDLTFTATDAYKQRKKWAGKLVLGSINLLSETKGLESCLEAVARIKQKIPQVMYVIIGQTHPVILERKGEAYRNFLKKRIRDLKISANVRFINRYLSLEEIITWLKTIDIYLTPYLTPYQAASGALSYAVGAGKFCISTPYLYAREILGRTRGVLVPFGQSQAIAEKVIYYWRHPRLKHKIETSAYAYGRLMTWPNVALQYLNLFQGIIN